MGLPNLVQINKDKFGVEFNQGLAHQIVTAYLAGGRSGSKAQKTRHEVRGGGIKPWKQKGTGRARAGSINSPLWRGGGRAFAAMPRDFSQKVNKKMYKRGMVSILSELIRQDRLLVVDAINLAQPKTRELKNLLKNLAQEEQVKKVLLVLSEENKNIHLAARNLIDVTVCEARHINPVHLVSAEKIVLTQDAFKQIEERLA